MKIKNTILTIFTFASVALCATLPVTDSSDESHQIDTKDWIRFPAMLGYDEHNCEGIELLFPSEPEFLNPPLTSKPFVVAKDSEGMTYKFSFMIIPSDEYNLLQSFEFLIGALSSDNKIMGYGKYQENVQDDSGYVITYVNKDGKQTTLSLIKSKHAIYFLETSVTNQIYSDVGTVDIGNDKFEIMLHDSSKHGAFARSLVITGEFHDTY